MGQLLRLLLRLVITVILVTRHVTAVDFTIIADDRGDREGIIFRAPMADLDSMAPIPLYGLLDPVAVDYDPVRRQIYWTDTGDDTVPPSISRANLDGTGQTIILTGIGEANGLSVDYLENVMYWTESDTKRIMKANTEPGIQGPQVVASINLTSPHDIVVDPAGRKLFWTDWGFPSNDLFPKVERLDLDNTTNRRVIIDGADHPGIMEPYGLSLDFEGQNLYFCDPLNNSIYLSDHEGYGLHNLIEIISPEIKPFDVAFYDNNVYWTDKAIPALIEAERYQGLYARIAGPFIFRSANGLIIHTDTDRSCYDGDPCMNGGRCRQFIVGYKCVCVQPYTGTNCEIMSDNSCVSNPCRNDAECHQFETSYECLCKTGYSGPTCETRSFLIVADTETNQIWTAPIPIKRGASYTEVAVDAASPTALDFYPKKDTIFWSDNTTISSVKRDGTLQSVVIDDFGDVKGIALDLINEKLYWTDRERQTIERSNLNGTERTSILTGLGQPWNIIVDPAGGYMYWTDIEKERHLRTIERAKLDGTDSVALIPVNLFEPLAIQADFSVNQLFFGDALVNKIETCDLDGRNRRVLIQLRQTDSHPFDIGLYQDIIYWSDNKLPRITALNRYGSTDGALLVGPEWFQQAAGMVIYEGNDGSCSTGPCQNNGICRQLPVGYQCVCDGTGFVGKICETSTDNSCSSNPCNNKARCEQLVSGYKCVCLYGYSGEFCEAEDVMFIADQGNGTIYSAPMRTLTFQAIINETLRSPVAIRYDHYDQKVYWADNVTNKVERMNTNGSNREVVIDSGLINPTGLSIDRSERMIYVTDSGANNIKRVSMDGNLPAEGEIFVNADIQNPQHIVVDWRNNYVYWTNQDDPVSIERMKTDKTGREVVINSTLPDNIPRDAAPWMQNPYGLTIDYAEEVLYWGDLTKNKICSFDLVTEEQKIVLDQDILKETLIHPFDLVVYDEYLYWSDIEIGGLVESNRRFPVALQVGSVTFGKPGGLDIYYSLPACWAEPCKNGGTCYLRGDNTGSYTCVCPAGYTGVHCQIEINECDADPNPCENDGLCQDEVNDYSCFCPPGYAGDDCETDIDECADPSPCQNGGNCTTPEVNRYMCECLPGSCGDRCHTQCPPVCDSNPCQNFGTCTEPIPYQWVCECHPDYTGVSCEEKIPPCDSNPCQNGATCVEPRFPIGSYRCDCDPGWTGTHCEQDIQECVSNPCLYGGQCLDITNGYICACSEYYSGVNCEVPIPGKCDQPGEPFCQNGQQCNDRGGGYAVCICSYPYVGDRCEITDYCSHNPCLNEGTCSPTQTGNYTCRCYPGYTGQNCETDINECINNPCQNDGTCYDQIDGFACVCTDEYQGPACQIPVITPTTCDDAPCRNGGTCQQRSGAINFLCRCPDGYAGRRCEVDINNCITNPCANGGRCIDLVNDFMCDCPDPFIGTLCDEVSQVNGCPVPPLKNGFHYPEKLVYDRNEKVIFVCGNEYDIKGYTEATCTKDGWSNEVPQCFPKRAAVGNVGFAVGSGIGVAILLFLIILILIVVIYFFRESNRNNRFQVDKQVVEYTNQQGPDGDGFQSVHIGAVVDEPAPETTSDTAPIQPKDDD